jgi:hypothetical protein
LAFVTNVSFLDFAIEFVTAGMAVIIKMANITITANNSINVKPF